MAVSQKLIRPEELRYSDAYNDALRYALYSLWKKRCYYCDEWLKGGRDTAIDHLLPKSLDKDPQAKREALKHVGFEEPFDLDSVENLAPIHPSCNGPDGKGSADWSHTGYLIGQITKAKRRAADVRKLAASILNSHGLQQAIATVDSYKHFKEHGAEDTYAEAAQVMLQAFQDRLPHLFGDIIVEKQNYTFSLNEVMSENDVPTEVGVGLGLKASDQTILKLIESVSGTARKDLLQKVLRHSLEAARPAAEEAAADYVASTSSPANAIFDDFGIEIEGISHAGDCGEPVEMRISAEGRATVFVAPGSSSNYIQKDVEIRTPVDVRIIFPSTIGDGVEIEAEIVSAGCETAVDGPLPDWDDYFAIWFDNDQ